MNRNAKRDRLFESRCNCTAPPASLLDRRRLQAETIFRQQRERQQRAKFVKSVDSRESSNSLSRDKQVDILPRNRSLDRDNESFTLEGGRDEETGKEEEEGNQQEQREEQEENQEYDPMEDQCGVVTQHNLKKQRDFFYWRNQQAKIDALLEKSNLERVEMPSDGNCLFHAVASFFDSFTTHREVRERICDYIDANRERFEMDIVYSGYRSIDEYLKMMRRDREWGDAIMLNAFCLSFDINVVLFTPDGFSEMYPGENRAKMALVAFGQHYTATRVRSGPLKHLKQSVSEFEGDNDNSVGLQNNYK